MLVLLLAAAPNLSAEVSREISSQECRNEASGTEIVVCAPRRSPYRLPQRVERFDPEGPRKSVARERSSWIEEGDTGTGSCSAVGPGGWTGCMLKEWQRQRQQRGWYG